MVRGEEPYRRGMVVVPHADDAEWGCSGTVAKWCAEGWEVVYVICTDGSKGSEDHGMTKERLVKIREQEQRNAGKVLGLHEVVFLGYEDSMLEPTLHLRRDIVREIRRPQARRAHLSGPNTSACSWRLVGPSGTMLLPGRRLWPLRIRPRGTG